MALNRVKLGRAVTFMKYLAGVVSLIYLAKTLIWNRVTFPTSNSLNVADLVILIEYMRKKLQIFVFLFNLLLRNVKISRAYN